MLALFQNKRWIIWIILFIGVGVGWWFWEQHCGEVEWREYGEEARKRGVKLTALEMFPEPEPVPPGQNFAESPLWRRVFAASGDVDEVIPSVPGATPGPDGRADLKAIRAQFIENKWLPNGDTKGDDAEAILRGLKKLEKPLEELHAVSERPKVQFSEVSRSYPLQFPHAVPMARLGAALALKATAHVRLGQSEEAAAAWKDGMSLVRALESTPGTYTTSVILVLDGLMLSVLEEGIAAKRWNDAQLQAFGRLLQGQKLLARYQSALAAERAAFNSGLEEPLAQRDLRRLFGWPADHRIKIYARVRVAHSAWWRRNQIRLNQVYDLETAKFDAPSDRIFSQAVRNEGYARATDPAESGYDLFAGMAGPPFDFAGLVAHTQAQVRMGEIACALERFRAERGSHPERLEALVPQYLEDLPPDPCATGPFIYRVRDDGSYQLYSVGLNREDDHGNAGDKQLTVPNRLDWLWAPR